MTHFRKGIILGLLTGLLGVFVSGSRYGIDLEESYGLGFLFKLRGERQAPSDVVVIALDEQQSASNFNLPRDIKEWPRIAYAPLIQKLTNAGASVIVVDIHFKGKTRYDGPLAQTIKKAGNVVLVELLEKKTIPFQDQPGQTLGGITVERIIPPTLELAQAAIASATFPIPKVPVKVSQFWTFKDGSGDTPTMPVVAMQLFASQVLDDLVNLLKKALDHPRMAQAKQDPENRAALTIVQRIVDLQKREMVTSKKVNELIRSLKELFEAETSIFEIIMEELESQTVTNVDDSKIKLLKALLKMYKTGDSHYLNFYGPARTITTVPFYQAHQLPSKIVVNEKEVDLNGKVVFIGSSSVIPSTQRDGFYTVFTQSNGLDLSGVEICATAFANLLEDLPVRPLDLPFHILALLIWSVVIGMIWLLLSPLIAIICSSVFVLLYLSFAYYQFKIVGIWFPLITPMLFQLPTGILGAVLWNYVDANRERDMIKKAFGYYIPDSVVNQLSKNLKDLKSSSQLVFGTCLYTDVENYTTLSESMHPETLRTLMNDYYEAIFEPVEQYGGIVMGVKGDSMLAIWTSSDPNPDIRNRACMAALDVSQAVDQFNQSPGRPKLHTRLALHSGQISIGSVGGGRWLEHTAVGGMINTASRIEGLSKTLGTGLLASKNVLAGLDGFLTRKLGTFLLSGKSRPVVVHELIGQEKDCNDKKQKLCREFSTALNLYKNKQWQEAIKKFSKIIKENEDGPSSYYLKLCNLLKKKPPSDEWDGIIRLDKK